LIEIENENKGSDNPYLSTPLLCTKYRNQFLKFIKHINSLNFLIMKKLIFLFAMVFAVSMAMAQHTSTVLETGDNNTATVTQGFDGGGLAMPGNISDVEQLGDGNDAVVVQTNNGFGGQQHNSEILQTGDDNAASVEQRNATGNAIINQIGSRNTANVLESGNFDVPHPAGGLSPYDAYVLQTGDDNTVSMTIFGDGSSSAAIQDGNNNLITQQLGQGVGEKVYRSSAYANQLGDRNEASQVMEGQGFAGDIDVAFERERIWQTGDDNFALQLQTDNALPASVNYAEVRQTGNENESWQYQTGTWNDSRVAQDGLSNFSTTTQVGDHNTIVVNQN
jgi:hypothetical protein